MYPDMSSRTTSTDRRQSRLRKLKESCDECASTKVKCTREQPTCSRCFSRGLPCQYSTSRRRGKHKASPIALKAPEWRQTPCTTLAPANNPIPVPTVTNYLVNANTLYPTSCTSTVYSDGISNTRDNTPFDSDPSDHSIYDDNNAFAFPPVTDATTNPMAAYFNTLPVDFPPWPLPPAPKDCKTLALQYLHDHHVPRQDCTSTFGSPSLRAQEQTNTDDEALRITEKMLTCPCAANGEVALLIGQILSGALASCFVSARAAAASGVASSSSSSSSSRRMSCGPFEWDAGMEVLIAKVQRVGGLVDGFCALLNRTRGRGGVRKAWEGVNVLLAGELKAVLGETTRELLRGSLYCA